MNFFLRKIHRWVGFPLGLLFLITFGTGLLTAVDELFKRIPYQNFEHHETTVEEDGRVIAWLSERHQNIRQITMPSPSTPYYKVVLTDETFFYSVTDKGEELQKPLHTEENSNAFFMTVLQIHRNFLLGKEGLFNISGAHYVAWTSLIALLLSLLGLWLWLPMRKTFKIKNIIPNKHNRINYYYSHMTNGVVTLIVISFMSLTGASITYREIAAGFFGIDTKAKQTEVEAKIKINNDWIDWLKETQTIIPNSTIVSIQFPRKQFNPKKEPSNPPTLITFRLLTENDWLGMPNSHLKIDPMTSTIVSHSSFEKLPLAEKLFSFLKPLHTGRGLPAEYVLILFIVNAIGMIMVFSGIASFVLKKRRAMTLKFLPFKRFTHE